MIRTIIPLFLMAILTWSCTEESSIPSEVTESIDALKAEYAPDKRVAIWEITPIAKADGIVLRGETNFPEAKQKLLDQLVEAQINITDSIRVLPAEDLEGQEYGVVNLSVCNIRSKQGHSQELATQATLGTILRVYKKENGWYRIQTPDHYLGWLDASGFELMDGTELEAWKQKEKVVYLPDFGVSLSEPAEGSTPVSDLTAGNILAFEGSEGGFVKISYPDGREAYLPTTEVMNYQDWKATRAANVDNILEEAFQFMGRPYLWGGTSTKGVDCSGFTKSVFYLNGVILPRDASQQVHVGIDVPTDTTLANLQRGDLLFFGRKATAEKKERITHVAIYLGDGKIIHSSGTVKVESLRRGDPDFTEYRLNSLVQAKRMLTSLGENGVNLLADSEYY